MSVGTFISQSRAASGSRLGLPQALADLCRRFAPGIAGVLAAALVVARQPAALLHSQIWAEAGTLFYANVHNLGLAHALILPQAGDLGTFTTVATWLSGLVSLQALPVAMAVIALAAQVVPIVLLCSDRASRIAKSLSVRVLISVIVVLAFHSTDLDVKLVNAQWWLALAALVVLLSFPARTRAQVWSDGLVLVCAGLTGPFAFALAPVAWWQAIRGRNDGWPRWPAFLLSGCAAIQATSILVISPADIHKLAVEPLFTPRLGANAGLLLHILGGRVLLGSVIGERAGLQASVVAQCLAVALALLAIGYVIRRREGRLIALLLLAGFVLGGGLALPAMGSPAWPAMAAPHLLVGEPYFLMAELSVKIALLWLATDRPTWPVIRFLAGAALVVSIAIAAGAGWHVPLSPARPGYDRAALRFGRAQVGQPVFFPIAPAGWTMVLTR